MFVDKTTLKDYLVYRSLILDDNYDIKRISSYKITTNLMKEKAINISLDFSLNDSSVIFTEDVTIHYNSYMNFMLEKRNQKLKKIVDGIPR